MPSPVPKHLRTDDEIGAIPRVLQTHVIDVHPNPKNGVKIPLDTRRHRAKYAPGLATELLAIAGTESIGETGLPVALNDIDRGLSVFLDPLTERGCEVSFGDAREIPWKCEVCVFSPPYYPKTDRKRACAHDDEKRGPVVGFRDSYDCDDPRFIGNPGGVNAILDYRHDMTEVYRSLTDRCRRMVVVTKNWTRLGVELRLDLDTILMAESVGWKCVSRHGLAPPPSLWARYNAQRGGGVLIEDILVFDLAATEATGASEIEAVA